MHPTPPPDDPKRTATASRTELASRAMHVAPPTSGPVEATAHTVLGLPVTAEPSTVAQGPVNKIPEPPPETMDPGLLVTRDSQTGHAQSGDAPTTAGRKAPAPIGKTGLLTGTLFEGKYQVGALLGEGGMGQVYRATHILMRKDVALKVLKPAMSVHSEIVERFRREAESAARLSHPGIIAVLDFGRSMDGTFYLVMEFLEGHSLSRALREGPMDWRRVCRLGILMLDALAEAHKAGVVHRDLKPDNIMLQVSAAGEESLKLVDFGIAKLIEDGGPQLTAAGLVFGTPSYLSPEQAQGQPVTHAADLYAMGVILFQMLTGRLPFKASSTMELLAMHIQEPPPHVRDLVPGVPEALDQLVLRALGKKPGDRPGDAAGMASALADLLQTAESVPAAPVPMPPPPAPAAAITPPAAGTVLSAGAVTASTGSGVPGRPRILLFAGLAVVCVLAIGLGLAFSGVFSGSSTPSGARPPVAGQDTPVKSDAGTPREVPGDVAMATGMTSPQELARLEAALKGTGPAGSDNPGSASAPESLQRARLGLVAEGKARLTLASIAQLEKGPAVELVRNLREWIEWFPQDAQLHLRLGLARARLRDFRKSLDSLGKALQIDPLLKREKALHAVLNHNLILGTHWQRQLTLRLIREHYMKATPEEVSFLLVALNDDKFDTDHRYELHKFVTARGFSRGIDEERFWTAQLSGSTTCRNRLEAAGWFRKNGHRGNVAFLKAEAAKRFFHLSSGTTQSSDCYRAVLLDAVTAAAGREPGKTAP
ncbi:protein kinase [Myxococcota bacterium]|nr:protein kinase [Myxococcota bacterium]